MSIFEYKKKLAKNLILIAVWIFLILLCFAADAATGLYRFFLFFARFVFLTLIVYEILSILIKLDRFKKTAAALRWVLRGGYALWLLGFVVFLCFSAGYSTPSAPGEVDYVIVLGAGLNNGRPSPILTRRLNVAKEALDKYPGATAILTGGMGAGSNVSESRAMYDYLTQRGVPPSRLLFEENSRDSAENVANAAGIIRNREGPEEEAKVLVVTCKFHMMRARLLVRDQGLEDYGAPSKTEFKDMHYYVREYFSMMIYLVERSGVTLDTSWFGK